MEGGRVSREGECACNRIVKFGVPDEALKISHGVIYDTPGDQDFAVRKQRRRVTRGFIHLARCGKSSGPRIVEFRFDREAEIRDRPAHRSPKASGDQNLATIK